MFILIQSIMAGLLGFFFLYLSLLSLLAFLKPKEEGTHDEPKNRFAIVIPAYNEEYNIRKTLESLLSIDYPKKLYDVVVIADNCTDRTAEIARQVGVNVKERFNDEKRSKGFALKWGFEKILKSNQSYDAFVVVDADSVVTSNLLQVMNDNLIKGAKVIQGYLTVQPRPGVWSNEMIRIGFTLYNYVRPLGRQVLGFPTGLRGNGMCFSTDIIRDIPWTAYSLAEDMEYGLKVLLKDIDITFAPEALGIAIMPETPENAESQRERWEMGRFPLIREYGPRLIKGILRKRSFKLLDTFIDLIIPPVVNMELLSGLMVGFNIFFWMLGLNGAKTFIWIWGILAFLGVFHVVVGLWAANSDKALFKALLQIPKYAFWKLKVYAKILLNGPTTSWVRTSREQQS